MKPTDSYEAYRRARDAAWQTLLQLSLCTLPVDVYAAAARLGVKALPFPPEGESPLLAALLHSAGDAAGVSVRIRGEWHVFLRPGDATAKRFALAHELGHILLGHRENAAAEEAEADCFAQQLLCPAPVLRRLAETAPLTPERVAAACYVSMDAARARLAAASRRVDRVLMVQMEQLYSGPLRELPPVGLWKSS